ncbi:MAG: AlpA family phage regulatory protein [Rhodospirillales bacterium]|nr:AlpA family phage regulatory protein [Rhodospirillales bacterium]
MLSTPSPERFLDRAELKARGIRLCNVHLLRKERAGEFPRRVYLGPCTVVWRATEIDAWCAARIADREKGGV